MTAPIAAARSGERPAPPRARLGGWKAVDKGALRGFARIELPLGLILDDVPVYCSGGRAWAALPARPVLDRKGRHVQINGRRQYAAVAARRNRGLADRFSARVVELVRQAHPDALPPASGIDGEVSR